MTCFSGADQGYRFRASMKANTVINTASSHRAVFKNFLEADRFRSREAAAIDVHVEKVGAGYNREDT